MKIKTGILFLFLSVKLFGQTSPIIGNQSYKSLLVVFIKNNDHCGPKAILIKDSTVLIDTCYNSNKKEFNIDKIEAISGNILFSRLLNLSASQWKYMENDIKLIINCDYAAPYEIELRENGNNEIFLLNRISNCYPSSAKYYLEALDIYFKKL
jgi:hypothetical protein